MTMFRLYNELRGGHVHCRLFAGETEGALGQCGAWVMRRQEFDLFAPLVSPNVEFRPAPKSVSMDPLWAIGRALSAIPGGMYLEFLRETPGGWNAKISDKIDDAVSYEAAGEVSAARAIWAAIKKRAGESSCR